MKGKKRKFGLLGESPFEDPGKFYYFQSASEFLKEIKAKPAEKIKQSPSFSSAGITIYGDSIFATSWKQFGKELSRITQKEIADYSTTGAWSRQIANQYYGNKPQPDSIVVFDGGGNDVLGNSGICRGEDIERCKPVVKNAANIVSDLLTAMENDGV